ncbi:hypothetical protein E2P81_ATG04896 [Venturia nashicola]|uniref:Uncharacterized protein n=1 Tax=Venturia nashicola TaxID=86259 RepID=A0A4Z1PA97_9PEZI|nr:hypothetical protein E6O75_ATG05021 [Venturia nashicola]TLD34731.1 hypothetical protein E2P81_ATG04896 [Venturia nashicola]
MLNLWSQVGRVGCSCRCPSCLTTKHKLVRRVSTAIATVRTRPKTSSTFLYSAIFAAATVTDGYFKRQRRARWDDAISKAHAQLETSQRAIQDYQDHLLEKSDASSREIQDYPDHLLEKSYAPSREEDFLKKSDESSREEDLLKESDESSRAQEVNAEKREDVAHPGGPHGHFMDFENVIRYAPKPGAPIPPYLPTTEPLYYPSPWGAEYSAPQSLWSGEYQRMKAYARIWTKKKISKAELASARLAVEMIMAIELESISRINLGILPQAVREIAYLSRAEQNQLLADLKVDLEATNTLEPWEGRRGATAGMTVPQYEQREDKSHYPIVEELNESILGLLRAYKTQEIGFVALVIKIVHNLLVSSAPPDLQTVNLLLLGFHGPGDLIHTRSQITGAVIHFCFTVRVRPNEVTCSAILACYIDQNKPTEFANFIGLMRAADGTRGLMLAKPDIKITEASQGRLVQHDQLKRKVFQGVSPSSLVFWQVIRGVLKFSGLQNAIEICKNFGKLAWGLDRLCLFELLRQCVKEEDWESGRWVWDQVEIFNQRHHKGLASIVGMMLALCLKCNERHMFDKIFSNALHHKYNIKAGEVSPADLTDLAEAALWRIEHDRQIEGDGDTTAGEMNQAEEGVEEPLISEDTTAGEMNQAEEGVEEPLISGDTTAGEMNQAEDGVEEPLISGAPEMDAARQFLGMEVKPSSTEDFKDSLPIEFNDRGSDLPESPAWSEDIWNEDNPREDDSEQPKQSRIDSTKDQTDETK